MRQCGNVIGAARAIADFATFNLQPPTSLSPLRQDAFQLVQRLIYPRFRKMARLLLRNKPEQNHGYVILHVLARKTGLELQDFVVDLFGDLPY